MGTWLGLRDAAVLVAGTGGIGAAVAARFAGVGARVAVVDVDAGRVDAAAAETGAAGFVAELRDGDACRRVVADTRERMGRLDVLVHAIGINDRRPLVEFTDDEWRNVVDVNLTTAFALGQAAGKQMCAQRSGRIVFLSSVSGLLAHKNHGPYAATKGGINQLMRVMAVEWAPFGVTVNAIAPGYIETPLTQAYLQKDGVRAGLEALVPAGRLGTVDDVASAALFLASQHAAFVTGQVLYVDGGRTLV